MKNKQNKNPFTSMFPDHVPTHTPETSLSSLVRNLKRVQIFVLLLSLFVFLISRKHIHFQRCVGNICCLHEGENIFFRTSILMFLCCNNSFIVLSQIASPYTPFIPSPVFFSLCMCESERTVYKQAAGNHMNINVQTVPILFAHTAWRSLYSLGYSLEFSLNVY